MKRRPAKILDLRDPVEVTHIVHPRGFPQGPAPHWRRVWLEPNPRPHSAALLRSRATKAELNPRFQWRRPGGAHEQGFYEIREHCDCVHFR